ncbi:MULTISPECIES: hypothetical protein [unclassified Pseudomonas]|uniref:hypothetical protein n=1 Tax=unclassified Pseudomonas TaxID=196821 RepID=UPI00380DBA55
MKSDLSTPSSAVESNNLDEIQRDIIQSVTALSTSETVSRFGSANAEYIKGFTGVDNETGQRFAKGLADIAKHKVNDDPLYAKQNIKQQAGYSAEVATTSRDNAEAIISGSNVRTSRSDDLAQYGRNHNVVDRVQILDGQIIEGTQSQMKFVGNRDQLLDDIASENGKFSRYRGVKLELPSEQFEGAEAHCREKAVALREQAAKVDAAGKPEVAAKLRRDADNYEQLADNVKDSGLTTEDAIFYREHPELATALDIARTSHRAGVEGAKYGAMVGASISALQNVFAVAQGKQDVADAALALACDTAKAGALGYGTAFVGAALKGGMQQSGNVTLRNLANTNAPAMAVNVCLSLGSSIKRYVTGEISEAQLLAEVGEKGSGMLASSMMAAVGQVAIPIPFVGAAVGGMIGYTLSSLFYQAALDAARGAELSRAQLERTRAIQGAARERIAAEQAALDEFTRREIPQLQKETQQLFAMINATGSVSADDVAAAINTYATLLGKKLQFQTQDEFDSFMDSDSPLVL